MGGRARDFDFGTRVHGGIWYMDCIGWQTKVKQLYIQAKQGL